MDARSLPFWRLLFGALFVAEDFIVLCKLRERGAIDSNPRKRRKRRL
jgi:hypothetical protein